MLVSQISVFKLKELLSLLGPCETTYLFFRIARIYFFDNTLLQRVKERMPSMREAELSLVYK